MNVLSIVVPMAGSGKSFVQAGYTVPKPLVEIQGKPMIEHVIMNLIPSVPHKFIFIIRSDQYERYPYVDVFERVTHGQFQVIELQKLPQGAACTILNAIDYIDNDNELLIANADQIVDIQIDDFIMDARVKKASASIITFEASHPKWSFVRLDSAKSVIETAEKKIISSHATSGIYYFKNGSMFVKAALEMIEKDIRFNNEFYVAPSFNELILIDQFVATWEIDRKKMHSLGTAEDLSKYLHFLEKSALTQNINHKQSKKERRTSSKIL